MKFPLSFVSALVGKVKLLIGLITPPSLQVNALGE